jgi:arylsulfatase A-like enzyme
VETDGKAGGVGRNRRAVCGVLLLLALGLGPGCRSDHPEPATRVVLITLDTLRFDQLDPAAAAAPAMPRTLSHARKGMQFSRFYATSPVTQPSHATMFTGLHPWEHGITRNGLVLSDHFPIVAELFRQAGFATAAVIASFPLAARFGYARGFDEFTEEFSRRFKKKKDVWEGEWVIPQGEFFTPGEAITDRAIEALSSTRAARQFFWFHYFDPHSPWGSSRGGELLKTEILSRAQAGGDGVSELLERARRGYAADVAYLDGALDRLLQRLARDAEKFETHVLVVADHGESFGEGGSLGHGNRLNEEQIHVPAFILSPKITPGIRGDVAGSIDVPRTLLSLAGISTGDVALGGRDLTSAVENDRRVFAMRRTYREGRGREIRLDGQVYPFDGNLFCEVDAEGRIYRGDGRGPQAADDLLDAPARERLTARFRFFEGQLERSSALELLDPEVERALKSLGYAR